MVYTRQSQSRWDKGMVWGACSKYGLVGLQGPDDVGFAGHFSARTLFLLVNFSHV